MWVICSWFKQNAGKNERFTWKTLTVFYPFDAQEQIAHVAHCSFLKLLSEYLRLLFTEEQPERFAHDAHNKKRQSAICSCCSLKKSESVIRSKKRANRTFAFLLTKNKGFAQKTDERIHNPVHNSVAGLQYCATCSPNDCVGSGYQPRDP